MLWNEMRTIAMACVLLAAAGLSAQSLDGTWVSTEPLLLNLRFSMAFSRVGINSGDVGKSDSWDYHFINADTFTLSSGAISVRLFRRK
jgi:hypothetical protein